MTFTMYAAGIGDTMRRLVWLVLLAGAAAGCGGGGSGSPPPADPVPRQGSIRVLNAMPDAGAIVGVLSGFSLGNVDYAQSTSLSKFLVGRYGMTIIAPTPGGTTTLLVDNEQIGLTQEDEVSFLMLGTLANNQLLRLDNIEIDFGVDITRPATWPPPDYQIVHAATGVGAVDVYVTEENVDIATVAPTATLSFGEYTPVVQLDAALTYRVRVTAAGSTTVLFDSGPYTQTALSRAIYLLLDNFGPGGEAVRVGYVNSAGVQNFPSQTLVATWRFGNFVPDSGPVDVYLGAVAGTPVFSNVGYGDVSGYLQIDPTATTVYVTPANVPATTLYQVDVTPISGQARTMYLSGLKSTDTVASTFVLESLRSIINGAQFEFVDASPAAGTIDVYLTTAGQPITDATPILSAAKVLSDTTLVVGPGDYDLTITRSGTLTELAGPMRISLDAQNVYDAVLYDAAGGGTPLQFSNTAQALP
jgi:Domain of unknown function (DUF4397)